MSAPKAPKVEQQDRPPKAPKIESQDRVKAEPGGKPGVAPPLPSISAVDRYKVTAAQLHAHLASKYLVGRTIGGTSDVFESSVDFATPQGTFNFKVSR